MNRCTALQARGSTRDNTGVSDSVVNQLLTKIDGVNALNNVLIIGMTNRKDMLDEALMRPGRLEVRNLLKYGLFVFVYPCLPWPMLAYPGLSVPPDADLALAEILADVTADVL